MGNIVLNKPATASSYVAPYSASRAVNGSATPTSRWLCNTVPCWLSVNLQKMVWINRWVIRHMPVAGWREPQYVMTNFKLQGSLDGANWFDLDIVTNNTTKVTDRTITAVEVAFVRVYVTSGLQINPKLASFLELEVYEAPPTSPYLSNLTLSAGTLTPTFAKTTLNYTAQVGYDVTQITLVPTAEDSRATIKVNGVVVPSGLSSLPQNLNVGSNTINVQVTSLIGGLIQNYTVNVTRASSSYLTSLVVKNGETALTLNPAFNRTIDAYTASVRNNVSSVTVTAVSEDTNATIKIKGVVVPSGQASAGIPLNVGDNSIPVEVTSSVGAIIKQYTINVVRASNCLLSDLVLTHGTTERELTPPFTPSTWDYTFTIRRLQSSNVTLAPYADGNPIIKVNGVQVASGQATPFTVEVDQTLTVSIEVKASIGDDQNTYHVVITHLHT